MLGYNGSNNSLSGVTNLYTDLITSTEIDATTINGTTCGLTTINNTNLNSTNATISNLNAYSTVINNLNATTETIGTSNITTGNITTLNNSTGNITSANITNAAITNANITNDNVQNLSVSNYANFQTSLTINGTISQSYATASNNLTSTQISDLTVSGNTSLQNTTTSNITCDNITLNAGKSISQSGTTNNTLGTTTIGTLTVVDQINLPSNVSLPAPSIHSGNLYFNSGCSVVQDLSDTTNYNIMKQTSLTGLQMNGNIAQGSGTTTLLNTTVNNLSVGGTITQTALGSTCNLQTVEVTQSLSVDGALYTYSDAHMQTLECTSLTLNYDMSGNNISNDEFKSLNGIDTTQTIQNQINNINTNTSGNSSSITSINNHLLLVDASFNSVESEITTINSNISNINTELDNITNSNNSLQSSAVLTSGDQTINGVKTFGSSVGLSNGIKAGSTALTNTQLQTLSGISSNIQTQINSIISSAISLSGINTWTGINRYNTNLPTSSLTPTSSSQLVTKSYCDTNFLTSSSLSTINTNISTLQTNTTGITYSSPNLSINENVIINGNLSFSNTSSYIDMNNLYFYGANSQTLPTGTSGKSGLGIFWNVTGYGATTFLNYSQGSTGGYNFYSTDVSSPPTLLTHFDSVGNIITNGYYDLTSSASNGINTTAGLITNTVMGYLYGVSSSIQTQINSANTNISTLASQCANMSYNSSSSTTTFNDNFVINNNLSIGGGINVPSVGLITTTLLGYLYGVSSNIQTQLNTISNSAVFLSGTQTISGSKTFSFPVILSSGLKSGSTTISNAILNTLSDVNTGTTIQTQIAALQTQITALQTSVSSLSSIGTITSYISSTTISFAGNTNYTFPNQITLSPGTYLISAFIAYYSTALQSNVTYISNVCNYVSGPGQIVTGCNCLGTTAAIAANVVYQLNLPSTQLVISSTSSYCVYANIALARTFYCYQYAIQAIRIA